MRVLRWVTVVFVAAVTVLLSGRALWHLRIDRLTAALDAGERPPAAPADSAHEPAGPVPEPVARFLASAVAPNRRPVRAADVDTTGEFRMRPGANGWRGFRAHQRFNALAPGFVWDARIAMAPFFNVFVRDAYVNGRGEMVARALGVYAVANEAGSGELAEGQLMRFLAETMWFPSALRPGNGVTWTAIDDHRATASLTDRRHAVSLQFSFNDRNAITEVFAPARMRAVDGTHRPTPGAVRCWDHQERLGFRIPIACEAEWRLPEGPLVYWRGRVTNVRYDAVTTSAQR
jgi:hypothetical protein